MRRSKHEFLEFLRYSASLDIFIRCSNEKPGIVDIEELRIIALPKKEMVA